MELTFYDSCIFLFTSLFFRCGIPLLVSVNVVVSYLINFIMKMEAIRSPKTSVHTKATCRHIPEDEILHSPYRENLKSYIALTGWNL
jgi:hypothetical protein